MKSPAAIDAQVVDIQNDRLHKGFIKVTLHVAAERGAVLTEALGWPTYTTPVPVALARLDLSKVSGVATLEGSANAPAVRKTAAPENRMKTRCAILCGDPAFWKFLNETYRKQFPQAHVTDAEGAASLVRFLCDVKSRSEIMPGTRAAEKWDDILARFTIWEQADQYVEEPA